MTIKKYTSQWSVTTNQDGYERTLVVKAASKSEAKQIAEVCLEKNSIIKKITLIK
jgi:hypothetical protein